MTSEQEQLEQRLQHIEEFMAWMSGMMETLVVNQGQPLYITDGEQVDVLRARLQTEREKAAAEVAAKGATTAGLEEESADRSEAETGNPAVAGIR